MPGQETSEASSSMAVPTACQQNLKQVDRVPLFLSGHVGVDGQRRRQVPVAGKLLDDAGLDAFPREPRDEGMAKLVQGPVGPVVSLAMVSPPERDARGLDRRSVLAHDEGASRTSALLDLPPMLERRFRPLRQGNGPDSGPRLRRPLFARLVGGTVDDHLVVRQCLVPFENQRLRPAKACFEVQHDRGLLGALGLSKHPCEQLRLLFAQGPSRPRVYLVTSDLRKW